MIESSGFHNKWKGAVLIEFAIILPLLLIIMIGVLEVSLFLIQDNTLNKSVRESSRYLSRNLGLEGCYTNIAEDVVATNMNNLFSSSYADFNNSNGTYVAETICVNDSDGTISSAATISGISCSTSSATCAAGSHLHVRVRVTYNARMVTGGLIIPSWGSINFSPTLSATSIMRVQ